MPRKPKHPKEMTTEELAREVFHPEVLKELKRMTAEKRTEKRSPQPNDEG